VTDLCPLSKTELEKIDAYWRAANYLSVGQIYLMGNPLLREPLRPEHIKPRLLGHWDHPGTIPEPVERHAVSGLVFGTTSPGFPGRCRGRPGNGRFRDGRPVSRNPGAPSVGLRGDAGQ
jgi:XFP N-terminal domain